MSGMHWEKRNRERKIGVPLSERHMRLPGWRDKPPPISFRRWPTGVALHDNCTPAVQKKRRARITLAKISLLED